MLSGKSQPDKGPSINYVVSLRGEGGGSEIADFKESTLL